MLPFCGLHGTFYAASLDFFLHHLLDFIPLDYNIVSVKGAATGCLQMKNATCMRTTVYISYVENHVETVNKSAISRLFDKLRQNYGSKNPAFFDSIYTLYERHNSNILAQRLRRNKGAF